MIHLIDNMIHNLEELLLLESPNLRELEEGINMSPQAYILLRCHHLTMYLALLEII